MLKERHEIDTNFNHLHLKFSQMQTDEHDRKEKVRNVPRKLNFSFFSTAPIMKNTFSPQIKFVNKKVCLEANFLSLTYFGIRILSLSFLLFIHEL